MPLIPADVEKALHSHRPRAAPVRKKGRVTFIEHSILETGTNSFHDRAVLGHGRLGTVYRACLEDDTLAAVKRFKAGDAIAETQYQVLLISQTLTSYDIVIHHFLLYE